MLGVQGTCGRGQEVRAAGVGEGQVMTVIDGFDVG